ncbi:MAG: tetrahydromethanopterin S-methyltransferase subunit H, partial [Pseudomonadota bacterium]
QAIWEIKNKLGYPGGCAPANALYQWKKKKAKASPEFEVCGTSSYLLPISWGGNFILYGPIANASWVYPACATMDAMIAYGEQAKGINIKKDHPLYHIF